MVSHRVPARNLVFLFSIILVGVSIIACSLPGMVVDRFRQPEETPHFTPTISPTFSGKKPIPLTPMPSEETPYPGVDIPTLTSAYPDLPTLESSLQPYPGFETSYPGANTAPLTVTETGFTYPGETVSPDLPSPTSGYPAPGSLTGQTPYPGGNQVPTESSGYPVQIYPTYDPYPGLAVTPTTGSTYPGASEPSPSATLQGQAAATGQPALPVQPEPTFASPSATSLSQFPSATPIPYRTPTPTLSPTPTMTRTPLPAPPWVSARLRASNPKDVKLAAGKPQLVEFFAFWSGPSQAMAPLIQQIESEYRDEIGFVFLDIDDPLNKVFKDQLHFRLEPHFFLLDEQGRVIDQWVGYITAEALRRLLDDGLS